MNTLRRQLTLFIDPEDSAPIELIRQKYNPVQFALIPAHVTLCREHEIADLDRVLSNLENLSVGPITVLFDQPVRFDNGKGLLLPAKGENEGFYQLRRDVLKGLSVDWHQQEPHITLMHPRNSTCTDEIVRETGRLHLPSAFEFKKISLIEQVEGGQWSILRNFVLKDKG